MISDDEQLETINEIIAVLNRFGPEAIEGASVKSIASSWIRADFDDAEEIDDWLRARCFTATAAQKLERAGITPEQAALRTRAGTADYDETIGYKTMRGDLSIEEARRIITNEFWNT